MKRRTTVFVVVFWLGLAASLPAGADIGITNGLTHEKTASPGETYESLIVVKNFGDKTQSFKAYQTDYYFYSDGRQFYPEPGQMPRSNAKWITFFPQRLVLAAGESAEIKCVVKVPAGRDLSGTYWSLIMVEPVAEVGVEAAKTRDGRVKLGIKEVVRYGVQVISNIGDSGKREIKFLDTKLVREGQKKVLQVDVENIGERWLRPDLYVELFAVSKGSAGKYEGGKLRIFPASSVRYRVDLTNVPKGLYKAMIIVDNRDENVFGAEYQLQLAP
jgi:hypothetical protein